VSLEGGPSSATGRFEIALGRPAWLRYGVALVGSVLALLITRLLWPVFEQAPFMPSLLAIFVAGWFGGWGPSLVATVLSGAAVALSEGLPMPGPWVAEPNNALRLLLFVIVGVVASLVHGSLWSARRRWLRAEKDARESRFRADEASLRLAAIVESSEDAIVAKALDGTITFWNEGARRLFGYTSEEMLGRPISDIMPESHKHDMMEILERIRRGEAVQHFETERIKRNGEIVPVSLSVSPIRDPSGRIVGASKIARDISDRKRAEAERERLLNEAQEAARVREEFFSMAGHELRTPLTTLQLRLRTLRRRLETGDFENARESVRRTERDFERLTRLTEEILDVTRISAGRLVLEVEEVDLGDLVIEVCDEFHDAVARQGSELRIAAPSVQGQWDRSRLSQVVTNLLSNALKFGEGQPIEVRVESRPGGAALVVRDHGIGMSPEDQARIFQRFERAVSRRSYGGMGLGLWITHQIVQAHGGRISVESELGTGSTFRVDLPEAVPQEKSA
jgi:PAS domain S-box-containing protein